MPRKGWFLILVAACISHGGTTAPARADDPPDKRVEEIFSVWRKKLLANKRIKMRWTEKRFCVRGGMFSEKELVNETGRPIPATDMTWEVKHVLFFDGESMRYEADELEWSSDKSDFVPQHKVVVWNEGTAREFQPRAAGYPWGVERKFLSLASVDNFQPVLLAFCTGAIGWSATNNFSRKMARTINLDGEERLVLECSSGSRVVTKFSFWVNPAQDGSVYRMTRRDRDHLTYQVDLSYGRQDGVWYPTSWKESTFEREAIVQSSASTVTEVDFKTPLDPALFQFEFPENTWVHGLRGSYIAKEKGAARPITEEELLRKGTTYEELLVTESGNAGLDEAHHSKGVNLKLYFMLGGPCIFIVFVFAHRIVRRWRRSA